MSNIEINTLIEELNELEAIAEEAKAEAEAIKDSLKAIMAEQDTEELITDRFVIHWTSVLSNRFDTTTFKREHAEMYKQYTKQTASRRFSIA